MKVALLIYGSLNTVSGGYLYDRMLVKQLRDYGDEVEVVSLPWVGYGRTLLHNFSRSLCQWLANADFDLLLQDELNHPSLFWLNRRLKRQVRYPLLSIVHHLRQSEEHSSTLRWLYRWVERRYLHSVDAFIFNSQTTRQEVARLVGKTSDVAQTSDIWQPHVVAYPGGDRFPTAVTKDEILHRAHKPGPLRVLFVGNLIPRKGLHTLIGALCQLPAPDWRLDVVGDTAVNPAYTRRILHNLPTAVTLHGSLPDAILADLMRHSQVLAVPSQYEGFGIVYLEGMGFGLPAIGTTGGAAVEIISDGVNGYVVQVADTAVLARHLHHLHQNRDVLATMSLSARQRFLAHPTWAQSMAGVQTFLHEQVKG
ncbi:MAG: glycosyltransferase family 4 protein [Chloroflexi bacterium]|nr:glycosyltransferase family 4 protein [Ardenticatenaceae bacterium]MBL1131619.1 glycosyltransferase family 1 protein [Chloroflexota bacterium]NOG37734.1 glycosyltransferase family 4 protein [Chloroflexota bacterium]GIK58216.1 MAG: glycosyl transferase family 1 [Chloroflexota bacterium]